MDSDSMLLSYSEGDYEMICYDVFVAMTATKWSKIKVFLFASVIQTKFQSSSGVEK